MFRSCNHTKIKQPNENVWLQDLTPTLFKVVLFCPSEIMLFFLSIGVSNNCVRLPSCQVEVVARKPCHPSNSPLFSLLPFFLISSTTCTTIKSGWHFKFEAFLNISQKPHTPWICISCFINLIIHTSALISIISFHILDILHPARYIMVMKYELHSTPDFNKWLNRLKDTTVRHKVLARLARVENGNFGDYKQLAAGRCQ